jgi:hypothetical protein
MKKSEKVQKIRKKSQKMWKKSLITKEKKILLII